MIAPLRRRHRGAAVILVLFLPGLFVAALHARRDVPATNALVETVERVHGVDEVPRELDVQWDGAAIETRVLGRGAVLELEATEDPAKPDVLVYWRPDDGGEPYLLGSLAGTQPRRYQLPSEARASAGTLELFSLAHAETVAKAALPATGE